MTSEKEDQKKRPSMLKRLSSPTKPPATSAVCLATAATERLLAGLMLFIALGVRNISWIMGEACSRMPMPAVTLTQRMTQSSQNCGVLGASSAVTLAVVMRPVDLSGGA